MGYNARRDAVLLTLAALEQVLRAGGADVVAGGGVGAAREHYEGAREGAADGAAAAVAGAAR